MSDPVFSLLGIPFTRFGLGCALVLAVYLLALRLLALGRAEAPAVRLTALLSVPLCWLMARLTYVAVDFLGAPFDGSIYLNGFGNAALALRFWQGGYSLMGGLFGLLLALRIAEKGARTEPHTLRDAAAPALLLALALLRASEYGDPVGEGRRVQAQWLIDTGLCLRHGSDWYWPVCLLEALIALLLFVWILIRHLRRQDLPGDTLRTALFAFGLTQVFLQSLHGSDHMIVHFVRAEQVLAIGISLVCMAIWSARLRGDAGFKLFCWAVTLVCVGLCVLAEFGVDRWGNRLLAYALMAVCLGVIAWLGGRLRDWGRFSVS